jgi:glycosyltransferase involved in cell wall biosynthesis
MLELNNIVSTAELAARSPRAPGRRLRVAIVAASLRILGGQAVQAQRMLDGWRDDPAVEAWLVPINPVPAEPFDRLLQIKYVRTIVTQLFYWPLLIRELRRADVVHVFSASYSSFLISPTPAVIAAKLLGRPIVFNYHSGEAPDHLRRSAFARHVMRRRVDLNVVPSPFLRDVLASFGIPARVVFNSIDLDRFAYRSRDPLRPRLLSTRNFEPHYNVACTLRAFARVQTRYPDATLTVVGSGSQDGELRALAQTRGLRNVTFAGAVAPSEMPRYYADADLYVQTPSIDNMPLSVLEAFASGLPVVATRVGGVPAILTDEVHGLLAPDNDDEQVSAQVIRLLERPDYARQLAAAAHASCAPYAWPVVREGWLDAYRRAASKADATLDSPLLEA